MVTSWGGGLGAQGTGLPSVAPLAANVFEVVVAKPTTDPLTYAERLPFENLPFAQRQDAYRSVGTAFALPGGRFVTAAHVLGLDGATLNPSFALRDQAGMVYPLGSLRAFSQRRDYAVFEVPGLKAPGLRTAMAEVNSRVFTVGNALGQGIIVREGLFTSRTPEDLDGEWTWLRFSAPASPGNSGGPLIDVEGRVLGIVTMKSENENLNYALSLDQVVEDGSGHYVQRYRYRIPGIQKLATRDLALTFPLPQSLAEVRALLVKTRAEDELVAVQQIYDQRMSEVFPQSPGAKALWGSSPYNLLPTLASERPDGTWYHGAAQDVSSTDWGTGQLETGTLGSDTVFQLTRPSTAAVVSYSASPRVLMDQILESWAVTRDVAGTSVRIKSLGAPSENRSFVDRWGRAWIWAVFPIPFADVAQILLAHQTPSGAVGVLARVSWSSVYAYGLDFRVMADSLGFSYQATLDQWALFLADAQLRPRFFEGFQLKGAEVGPFRLQTPRWSLSVPADLIPLSPAGVWAVVPGWFWEEDEVLYEPVRFFVADGMGYKNYVAVEKSFPPADGVKTDRAAFDALVNATYPWTGNVLRGEGKTQINVSRLPVASGPPAWAYGLRLNLAGDPENLTVQTKFNLLKNGFSLAAKETGAGPLLTSLDGMTIFQALVGDLGVFQRFIAGKTDLEAKNEDRRTPLQVALRLGLLGPAAQLLDAGARVNGTDTFGMTALHLALRYGDLKTVTRLMDLGADIHVVDGDGITPLMLAAQKPFPGVGERMLDRGADPTLFSNAKHTALFFALQDGQGDLARRLVPVTPQLDFIDDAGWTLIHAAARGGADEIGVELLNRGLPWRGQNSDGWTALSLAARYGDTQLLVGLAALSTPDDVNLITKAGTVSVLGLAVSYCETPAAEALLKAGALTQAADSEGFTPLHSALLANKPDVVRLLLPLAPVPGPATNQGWSALHLAARYCPEVLEEVAARYPDLEVRTKASYTPLLLAAAGEQTEAFHWLLSRGARVDAVADQGVGALMLAVQNLGHAEVEALLDKGADPYALNQDGWSPLFQALVSAKGSVAALLSQRMDRFPGITKSFYTSLHQAVVTLPGLVPVIGERTPDLNLKSEGGWTPLLLAVYYHQSSAVKWLLDHGADPTIKTDSGESVWALADRVGLKDRAKLLPPRP